MPLDSDSAQTAPVIKCSSVYKIFGENADKMLREANGNVDAKSFRTRAALSASTNASFEVYRGEILMIMGFPGRANRRFCGASRG